MGGLGEPKNYSPLSWEMKDSNFKSSNIIVGRNIT